MSFPIKLSEEKTIYFIPTEDAEKMLIQLAQEHPDASIEELMDMLTKMKKK